MREAGDERAWLAAENSMQRKKRLAKMAAKREAETPEERMYPLDLCSRLTSYVGISPI